MKREDKHSKIAQRRAKLKENLKHIMITLKRYRPEKVILFGSLATGKIHPASDIDLLIIKETKKRSVDRIGEVLRLCRYQVAFEPIVITPQELKERLKWQDPFIEEVLKKGKVLYEKR